MDRYVTLAVPSSVTAKARAVFNALGAGHVGMVVAGVGEGVGNVSSGGLRASSPVFSGKQGFIDAVVAGGQTAADAEEVWNALDFTDGDKVEPKERLGDLVNEANQTVSAIDWVQPTGAQDAIEKGAIRKHNGKTWVSLQDANVFEPGVASWRETWSTATDTPPDWVQPSGSTDAYRTGSRVTHNGTTWNTINDFNVFEPGTQNAGWIDEDASVGDEWAEGVAYSIGDEVTYEGSTYRCIQAHTSISVWIPPNVPALWELI